MTVIKAAAIQISPVLYSREGTVEKVVEKIIELGRQGSAAAQRAPTPTGQQMTNAMYTAFGDNHSRAVHAKGILIQGRFTPDPAARSIIKAKLFTSQEATVLARFSDFTGIPTIPDNIMDANPRGMAVKFNVPDDSEADVGMHSFDGFPTRSSASS